MKVLDDRLSKRPQRQSAIGMVAIKVRKEGTPSDSLPPPGAPSWARILGVQVCGITQTIIVFKSHVHTISNLPEWGSAEGFTLFHAFPIVDHYTNLTVVHLCVCPYIRIVSPQAI